MWSISASGRGGGRKDLGLEKGCLFALLLCEVWTSGGLELRGCVDLVGMGRKTFLRSV